MEGVDVTLKTLIGLQYLRTNQCYKPKVNTYRLGSHLSSFKGQGMSFSEIRHYQPMDDIKHMEWRATARTGKPHIKKFEQSLERPIMIIGDFSPSLYFGTQVAFKSYIACIMAARIAWLGLKAHDKVGAILFNNTHIEAIPPRLQSKGALPLLQTLVNWSSPPKQRPSNSLEISALMPHFRKMITPGAIVVILSDGLNMNPAFLSTLRFSAKNADIFFYQLFDPIEETLPPSHLLPIQNGTSSMLLDTSNKQLITNYTKNRQQWIHDLTQTCQTLSISFNRVATTDNPLQILQHTFPRRYYG